MKSWQQYKAESARQIDPSDSMQIDRKEYEGIQSDVGATNFSIDGYRALSNQIVEALQERDEALADKAVQLGMLQQSRKFVEQLTRERDSLEKLRVELYERSLQVVLERDSLKEQLKSVNSDRDNLHAQYWSLKGTS